MTHMPDLYKTQSKLGLAINNALDREAGDKQHVLETHLVSEVEAYLKRIPEAYCWRQNVGGAKVIGRGGKPRVMRFGFAGIADIIGCYKGRFLAIECKIKKNKQSDQQIAFQENLEAAGGIYILAYTLGDVIRGLE